MFQAFVEREYDEDLAEEDLSRLFPDDIQSVELKQACSIARQFFEEAGHQLLSVIFCDCDDSRPAIRAFRNLPPALDTLSQKMKSAGGCPPQKEAQRLLQPFDWFKFNPSRYSDLQSMKFLLEVSKLPYGCVLGVPVRLGNGLVIFSVGIDKSRCDASTKRAIILDVLQLATAMIGGLKEVEHLFQTQKLSILEAKALMFAMQGFSNQQIAGFLKLGEVTVDMLFKSAADRIGAHNHFQLLSKAIADGEIANIQLTDAPAI
ncbi:MAG: hypothetical protein ABJM29_02775 [Rhizobiaceae bacterium]